MIDPLTAEELARMKRLCENAEDGWDVLELGIQPEHVLRLLAQVAAAEQEVARLRRGVLNALARLDGHTCHSGHTDSDHYRLYRGVVNEIEVLMRQSSRAALDGERP